MAALSSKGQYPTPGEHHAAQKVNARCQPGKTSTFIDIYRQKSTFWPENVDAGFT
jgi:hypothetical protein